MGIVILIAVISVIVKAADMEGYSRWWWGFITVIMCIVAEVLIPLGIFSTIIGGVATFLLMLAWKIYQAKRVTSDQE